MTPQAAPISLGRVTVSSMRAEPVPLLGRQVFGAGEQQPPVHPHRVGDRAAAAQQVAGDALPDLGDHLVGERDQMPLVDRDLGLRQGGADPGGIRRRRVDHHDLDRLRNASDCSPSHSRTQPPVRPGANPSSDPGPSREQSTKLVSHGSDRFQVIPSSIQRTDRNRVSSIPSRLVGSGSGSHRAAAATSALCAVGHDTPYSAATSETARLLPAIAYATRSRSRSVTRPAAAPPRRSG